MRSAVVIGAGVGGLAVAGALARSGWQVTLLERTERLRPARGALLLWPGGVRALHALGLGGGLDAIATPVPRSVIHKPDGQVLRRASRAATAETAVVVNREDLHDALVAGLSERLDLRTGVTVRVARPANGRPAVSDGHATWEADLVVAADGPHSAVRRRLAPQSRPVSGGWAAWRAVIPWYRAPQLPDGMPPAGETLRAGHRFTYASLGDRGSAGASSRGGIAWTAVAPGAARPEPPEVQLGLLRRWFAGWHAPVTDLLAATGPDDVVQENVVELKPLPATYVEAVGAGAYVLLAEAAHALADHLGLAPSLALEDAATLSSLLGGAPVSPCSSAASCSSSPRPPRPPRPTCCASRAAPSTSPSAPTRPRAPSRSRSRARTSPPAASPTRTSPTARSTPARSGRPQ